MASTSRTFFASQPLFALVLGVFLPALPATAQDVLQDGSSVDGSFTVDQDLVVKGDTRTDTLEVDGLATLDSLSVRLPISQGAQIGTNDFNAGLSLFDGQVCIGSECNDASVGQPANAALKLRARRPGILFEDTDTNPVGNGRDWRLALNDTIPGGFSRFSIQDAESGRVPFTVQGGALENTLWLGGSHFVGIGTTFPDQSLDIVSNVGTGTVIEMQNTALAGNVIYHLAVRADGEFQVFDRGWLTAPLRIQPNIGDDQLVMTAQGVGFGTDTPAAPLHLQRTDGSAEVLVENTAASPAAAARGMFTMRNNGGSFFTLDNTDAGTTWFFTHENSAPNRFIIADAVTDGPEFTLTADGDVTIPGNFISGSTTLNVPDYVFEDGYALRPLSEVQTFIAANKHLPDVPSVADVARDGLDLTQMQLAQLRKIEELTLYTLEQETRLAAQAREIADLRALVKTLLD